MDPNHRSLGNTNLLIPSSPRKWMNLQTKFERDVLMKGVTLEVNDSGGWKSYGETPSLVHYQALGLSCSCLDSGPYTAS